MRFWIREIGGWLLVLAGLYFCLAAVSMVVSRPSFPLSAIHLTVIGIFVFRGGIHLLKVSLAARLATAPIRQSIAAKSSAVPPTRPQRVAADEW